MNIITIRGQLGSGAPEIGRLMAGRLKIDYVDNEIIESVAERVKFTPKGITQKEMPPGNALARIFESAMFYHNFSYHEALFSPQSRIPLNDAGYLTALRQVINELADSGPIIIRGRGSQFILKERPNAVHILLVAPWEKRLERVRQSLRLDARAAGRAIRNFDSSRQEFIRRYFQEDLEDPVHYDLVVNTGHLDYHSAVSVLIRSIHTFS